MKISSDKKGGRVGSITGELCLLLSIGKGMPGDRGARKREASGSVSQFSLQYTYIDCLLFLKEAEAEAKSSVLL